MPPPTTTVASNSPTLISCKRICKLNFNQIWISKATRKSLMNALVCAVHCSPRILFDWFLKSLCLRAKPNCIRLVLIKGIFVCTLNCSCCDIHTKLPFCITWDSRTWNRRIQIICTRCSFNAFAFRSNVKDYPNYGNIDKSWSKSISSDCTEVQPTELPTHSYSHHPFRIDFIGAH